VNGTCAQGTLANTGDPCTKNTDCANGPLSTQKGQCLLTTGSGTMMLTWPMGYCTSACRSNLTDNTGVNPDCPGGNGTCSQGGTSNNCFALCSTSADCRGMGAKNGYSCFVVNNIAPLGCEPTALSMCDPRVAGSCPLLNGTSKQTCVNVGDGTVGECVLQCDPFMNTGCNDPNNPAATDCHASDQTGEGLCVQPGTDGGAGATCGNFYSDCKGGYGCLGGKCWKYCNTANTSTQCNAGATCMPFSNTTKVPVSIAGICSASL
jgi:hypothetical protein